MFNKSAFEFETIEDGTCALRSVMGANGKVIIPTRSPKGELVVAINENIFDDELYYLDDEDDDWNSKYSFHNVTSITIPWGVKHIDQDAFMGCECLRQIKVSKRNKTYHSSANCLIETESKKLILGTYKSIIPDDGSVTSIGDEAFMKCRKLTSISLPTSLLSIGKEAFSGCHKLESISIPKNVNKIGYCAFSNCQALKAFYVDDENKYFKVINDCLIDSTKSMIIKGLHTSVIPDDGSIKFIGDDAFSDCHSLTSITLPSSVKSIGYGAFCGCAALEKLILNEGLEVIGGSAFSYCSLLKELVIPGSVRFIGVSAFEGCDNLTSLTLNEGLERIDDCAFSSTAIKKVIIPSTVYDLGYESFSFCEHLKFVAMPDKIIDIFKDQCIDYKAECFDKNRQGLKIEIYKTNDKSLK